MQYALICRIIFTKLLQNILVHLKTILNGEHTAYNAAHQISKQGFFADNNLINSKMYIYNEDDTLKHVEHYKNSGLTGTTPNLYYIGVNK